MQQASKPEAEIANALQAMNKPAEVLAHVKTLPARESHNPAWREIEAAVLAASGRHEEARMRRR